MISTPTSPTCHKPPSKEAIITCWNTIAIIFPIKSPSFSPAEKYQRTLRGCLRLVVDQVLLISLWCSTEWKSRTIRIQWELLLFLTITGSFVHAFRPNAAAYVGADVRQSWRQHHQLQWARRLVVSIWSAPLAVFAVQFSIDNRITIDKEYKRMVLWKIQWQRFSGDQFFIQRCYDIEF